MHLGKDVADVGSTHVHVFGFLDTKKELIFSSCRAVPILVQCPYSCSAHTRALPIPVHCLYPCSAHTRAVPILVQCPYSCSAHTRAMVRVWGSEAAK